MKNIFDLLTEFGIAVPDEQKTAFEKALLENYRTKAETDKLRATAERAERAKQEAEARPDNSAELGELKKLVETLRADVARGKAESRVRDVLGGRKFANAITEKAIREGLVEALMHDSDADPAAVLASLTTGEDGKPLDNVFVTESAKPTARFTAPKNPAANQGATGVTKEAILSMTDASARQKAIAENMGLFAPKG